MYVCPAGHMAIRKARTGKKNQGANQAETYSFDIEKCKVCPYVKGAIKKDPIKIKLFFKKQMNLKYLRKNGIKLKRKIVN